MLQCFKHPPAAGQLSEDSQCTLQSLCEWRANTYMTGLNILTLTFSVCVNVCGRADGDDGQSAAAQGAVPSVLPPPSLLGQRQGLTQGRTVPTYPTGGGGGLVLWYLLDLRVGSGRGTDFTARTRRLVDESAGRTGPLRLLRKYMLRQN